MGGLAGSAVRHMVEHVVLGADAHTQDTDHEGATGVEALAADVAQVSPPAVVTRLVVQQQLPRRVLLLAEPALKLK